MRLTRRTAAIISTRLARAPAAELVLETREELINALMEAAELEHGLLVQYLFAAMTAKRNTSDGLTDQQVESVRDWQRQILRVAREEMAHLGTVCNLLTAIGGAPHFSRPNFPQPMKRWYPFDFQLQPINEETLKRFVLFEQPVTELNVAVARGIAPDPILYNRVGELYRAIRNGFELADTRLRSQRQTLFIGPGEAQDSDDWTARLNIRQVRDLPSAQAAIDFVIIEGEGAPENRADSHYQAFVDILAAFRREKELCPDFDPALPVISNPATREHRDSGPGASLIDEGTVAHDVAELFNSIYTTMLLMLMQFYDFGDETPAQRAVLQASIRHSMSAIIRPIAEVLARLPAGESHPGKNAGPGFELYGELQLASHATSRWGILIERVRTAASECRRIYERGGESVARLGFIARNLDWLGDNIAAIV